MSDRAVSRGQLTHADGRWAPLPGHQQAPVFMSCNASKANCTDNRQQSPTTSIQKGASYFLNSLIWGFPPTGRAGILAAGQLSPKTPQQRQNSQTLLKCLQPSTLQAQVSAALIRKDKVLSAAGGGNKNKKNKKSSFVKSRLFPG